MSTTYGIFKEKHNRTTGGQAIYGDDDCFIIGRLSWFTIAGEIVAANLSDDTLVYALDNDSTIRTLKDLKKYYESFNY